MMNKGLVILGFMLMIPLALALTEGDTYTQNQIDNFHIENVDTIGEMKNLFECQYEGVGTIKWIGGKEYYYRPFSCLQLDKYGDGYILNRQTYYPRLKMQDYRNCVDKFSDVIPIQYAREYCQEEGNNVLIGYSYGKIWKIKKEIINYQTVEDNGEDFVDDGGLF